MNPRTALVVALSAALVLVPASQAYHYSVGSQDSVGVAPEETPDSPDTSEELYERGTSSNCSSPPRDLSNASQGARQRVQTDPFCGRLVYHEGTNLSQISPPDQDILFDEWTFDVVLTQYVGTYGLDTCYPWCAPGGVIVLDALERTLQAAAPDVFAGDHEDEDDHGHQSYAVDLRTAAPGTLVQREVVQAEGSGWMLPTTDPTFVGFLRDGDGQPVNESQLTSLVPDGTDRLPSDAAPLVCGFSPDFDVGGPTEDAPLTDSVASSCDVLFSWQEGGHEARFGPEEDERCSSAAYVCGEMTPAWYGQLACNGWAGCQSPHQAGDAWHSSADYDVWHFVAAPAPSDCNGAQQPGFRTSVETAEADLPYLAHDLDVYSHPTSTATNRSPGELPEAWAGQVYGPFQGQTDERIDPGRDGHEALDALQAPSPAQDAYEAVYKEPIPEPNAEGDTSKSITVSRTADDCDGIGDLAEEVVDPWVNQIDTRQRYWTWNGMKANTLEPYANTEDGQDQNNRPGPGFYLSDGMVGMFADKDDDGAYDQASPEALFRDVHTVGAYPMFYDMRLDENLHPSGGCQPDFSTQPLAEAMEDAGYGPRTGLVEAIYLEEPTALHDRRTGDTRLFPASPTVFLAKTQAIKALEAEGAPEVVDAIEATIDATGAPESANVVDLHSVKPQPTDFWDQCGQPTGRYVQEMMFYHDCTVDCSGDTVATTYLFEVNRTDGTLGGGGGIPAFQADGQTAYAFGEGLHTWTDVDPFDGDPDRNTRDGTPDH